MSTVLIGADPEVFLRMKGTDMFIPSLDLIGGTKELPLPVDRGALQEDNVTAEFNIDPSDDPDVFVDNIYHVMAQLQDKVGQNIELVVQSSAEFEPELLFDPRARAIGCDPDMNAYSLAQNKYDIDYDNSNIRYAGGHIHLGAKEITQRPKDLIELVRLMDLHVGTLLTYLDLDRNRYKNYGKAGNYRVKPYGVEYRTASNYWLTSKELTRDVHMLSQRAFHLWNTGVKVEKPSAMQAINSHSNSALWAAMPLLTKEIVRKYF